MIGRKKCQECNGYNVTKLQQRNRHNANGKSKHLVEELRSILLFWDKRSIQMASYLTQNDIAKFIFFLKVRHKFLIMIMVPRKIQVCHLDTSYRTKHSFLRAKISNPLHPVIWDSHF